MNKHKHLDYIQDTVKRMADNSFKLKGWTVTLVSALLALSLTIPHKILIIGIAMIPIIFFWILDGYFLFQERLFRALYDDVRKKINDSEVDFSMNISIYKGKFFRGSNKGKTWIGAMFSPTLNIFYFPMIIALWLSVMFLPLILGLSN